jgi:thiamine monophosphate synthase
VIPHLLIISPGRPDPLGEDQRRLYALSDDPRLALIIREPDRSVETLLTGLHRAGAQIILHLKTPGAMTWIDRRPHWGLHISADQDLSLWRPKLTGPLGQSTHSLAEAQNAFENGADYITLSPLFRPRSKPDDTRALIPRHTLTKANQLGPTFALGGLNAERFVALRQQGIYGGAVLGDVFIDPHPIEAYFQNENKSAS